MSGKRDYYEILGIDRNSNASEIKNAFRSLARKYHPDKNQGDPESEIKFKEVQEAYAVLSVPNEKKKYDTYGHNRPGGSPFGPRGFEGVNISIEDLFGGGFESVFGSIFGSGGRNRRTKRQRGSDLLVRHSVAFQAVMDGSEESLEFQVLKTCKDCSGLGSSSPEGVRECPACDGRGRIQRIERVGPFTQQVVSDCSSCQGDGRIVQNPCSNCQGDGRANETKKVQFTVPAGIENGTRLRMSGYGESAKSENGDPGHLYIEIEIDEHEWFERDGADLLMAIPLSYTDLVLGATIEIPHLDGENLKIKVPSGSKPGDTISLKGRGLPSQRTRNGKGSVMVLLKLDIPSKISRGLKKKLLDIKDEISFSEQELKNKITEEAKSRRKG
ncbi:MAG: J domain-containing protein [Euryarchaeota archaeon]|jgi:molecular chaperone DnaJ|nr:J domain-containing protein [Euryarchaeota archaeon]MBT3847240.1 J domain-containing protein [Euryarchaeota archaeon]MBT4156131.1 J domain-containing protein [Euryarchaeota archaeon]MBT4475009.1 J domain-containing protein [Euryarchaeota archaeon]MBT4794131.1 J domain-containing protein [Euryarchaeota archaeon]